MDIGTDSTVSIIAHEIVETLSNPNPGSPAYLNEDNEEVRLKLIKL